MIDINELRKLAQAATPGPWYIGSGTYEGRNIYSAKAVTDDEGFTYNPVVATAEDDGVVCWDANARLIAAANPAAISELFDRLEAAESSSAWHQRRWMALQMYQTKMREPERTVVCDIIANGELMHPTVAGDRYAVKET